MQTSEPVASPAVRTYNRVVLGLSFALYVWAGWYPQPYAVMIVVLGSLPWIAFALARLWPRRFVIRDLGISGSRIELSSLPIAASIGLLQRAIFDASLVDPWLILLPGVVGLAVLLACAAWASEELRDREMLIMYALLLCGYPAGFFALANAEFDHGQPRIYEVRVQEKRHTSGRGSTDYFKVSAWGPRAGGEEVSVSSSLYGNTSVGDMVCIRDHVGALGMEWYEVRARGRC